MLLLSWLSVFLFGFRFVSNFCPGLFSFLCVVVPDNVDVCEREKKTDRQTERETEREKKKERKKERERE